MKTKVYHIGIYKHNKTVVLQAVNCIDDLNCEIIKYYGQREITKANLKLNKAILLDEFKKTFDCLKDCKYIRID